VPDRIEPFDVLRRPIVPVSPRAGFANALRRQLIEELRVSTTDQTGMPTSVDQGSLQMVHVGVGDADRAMQFYGTLFGWVGERYVSDHVSHYILNTSVTVRLVDDPTAAPLRPNYAVSDVGAAVQAIEQAGGRVTSSEVGADGGGWAFAEDNEGLPILVFRPSDRDHATSDAPATGDVAILFVTANTQLATDFYRTVLGWELKADHPGGTYYQAEEHVGVWDANAAMGTSDPATMTLYLAVPALRPIMDRIEELGGHVGPMPEEATMGHFFNVVCTDDQGTTFGLISEAIDLTDLVS
jgi:predicted enzyme related to lactoylglutathione lyase